jgi:hypothetical protein
VWELEYGTKREFLSTKLNVLKKRNSLFATNVKRSSAQRENRTESERKGVKGACVCLSFRCSFRHNKYPASTSDGSCVTTLPNNTPVLCCVDLRTG